MLLDKSYFKIHYDVSFKSVDLTWNNNKKKKTKTKKKNQKKTRR